MRASITLLVLLLLSFRAQANTLFDQLRDFNPYWEPYAEHLQGLPAAVINDDVDYVQVHLEQVLTILSDANVEQLSEQQRELREELVAILKEYASRCVPDQLPQARAHAGLHR